MNHLLYPFGVSRESLILSVPREFRLPTLQLPFISTCPVFRASSGHLYRFLQYFPYSKYFSLRYRRCRCYYYYYQQAVVIEIIVVITNPLLRLLLQAPIQHKYAKSRRVYIYFRVSLIFNYGIGSLRITILLLLLQYATI